MGLENEGRSRLEAARAVVAELLDNLEGGEPDASACLMKAKRLARLLRDEDAQLWLDLELRGYPEAFDVSRLGSCLRYVQAGGRVKDGKYYDASLPALAAAAHAQKASIGPATPTDLSLTVENYASAGATQQVLRGLEQQAANLRSNYATLQALYVSILGGVHSYASDSSIALEFGDAVESIFEQSRRDVDLFVRSESPAAAQQLIAISERIAAGDAESLSQALTACRRLLLSVADAVFPASDEDYIDAAGKPRKVGKDEYKNRLIAFFESRAQSASTLSILSAEVEHMAARVDAVYEKVCKGVHVDVDLAEARLTVITVYLLIGEVVRLADRA